MTVRIAGQECSRDRVICWVEVRHFYLSVRPWKTLRFKVEVYAK